MRPGLSAQSPLYGNRRRSFACIGLKRSNRTEAELGGRAMKKIIWCYPLYSRQMGKLLRAPAIFVGNRSWKLCVAPGGSLPSRLIGRAVCEVEEFDD
jgi:hypothetical protein